MKSTTQTSEHAAALAVAKNLERLRNQAGLTQAELAQRADVTVETIARLERVVRGRASANSNPSLGTLVRIADALGCGLEGLLGFSGGRGDAKTAHKAWRLNQATRLEREAAYLRQDPR